MAIDYFKNVTKDYSADPTDNNDDSGAIQNALDDAYDTSTDPHGFVIYIPPGDYIIDNKLTVGQRTIIKGAGKRDTTLICSNNTCFYAANSKKGTYDIQISDLKIKCDNPSGSDYGIHFESSDTNVGRIDLRNILINGFDYGVWIDRPIVSQLTGVVAKTNNEHGIVINGNGTSTTLKNCFAADNGKHGYVWRDVGYSSLINCAADKNGRDGYHINPSGDEILTNITLDSCGAEGNNGDEYFLDKVWGLTINSCTALPGNTDGNGFFLNGIRRAVLNGIHAAWKPNSPYVSCKIDDRNGNTYPAEVVIIGCKFGNSEGLDDYGGVKVINSNYTS